MIRCEKCSRSFEGHYPLHCICGFTTKSVNSVRCATQWPRWALTLKRLRTATDKGVGDTAQRIAAKFGGERYKRLTRRLGMPCGCSERQDEWNRLYPYGD